jgi:hypothetical protein
MACLVLEMLRGINPRSLVMHAAEALGKSDRSPSRGRSLVKCCALVLVLFMPGSFELMALLFLARHVARHSPRLRVLLRQLWPRSKWWIPTGENAPN